MGNDFDSVVKAMKKLAKKMHKRDTKPRKVTNAPYITHPAKVVEMLKAWGYSEADEEGAVVLSVAWGHDLLEDTKVTKAELAEAAGPLADRVIAGIETLTFDEASGLSKDDYILNVARTAKPEYLVVKMADRLCNTLDFVFSGNPWCREYLKLGEPLFERRSECKADVRIKATLDEVSRLVTDLKDPGFPKELTAEMLKDFKTTPNGCTHPRVGTIAGHRFIAKCGSWSAFSSDEHVHGEFVADNLLRFAGLNVPYSREYRVDFGEGRGPQTVRLAVYDDALVPIMEAWGRADAALRETIRRQAIAAYPVQTLIAGIDTFTWDNVKVDANGGLWFVDNGASFDFRACGKLKGWFWDRKSVHDAQTGYLSLAHHPNQYDLREILGAGTTDADLWAAAKEVPFRRIVRQLPDSHRTAGLKAYAKQLQEETRKA